ncbi:MAG: hypothetical protein A2Y97_07855 [Nitrospirae bacterium RBG_13_39_12]|nr:MAG: hypothetical protein A2Y97_07855 [Nitrospirae bacterium RBG_13_39_12]
MVQITLALLADCANVSREGKLNITGIFDRISAQSLPATHPQMQLVMTLEADRGDANKEHKLAIELINADGVKKLSMAGDLKFGSPPPGEQVRINHIIQLNNIKFEDFGVYEFKILMNNEVRKSVPLHVKEVKK